MKDETVWLSLDQMATLFDRDKSVISRHIKNALEDRSLQNLQQFKKKVPVKLQEILIIII